MDAKDLAELLLVWSPHHGPRAQSPVVRLRVNRACLKPGGMFTILSSPFPYDWVSCAVYLSARVRPALLEAPESRKSPLPAPVDGHFVQVSGDASQAPNPHGPARNVRRTPLSCLLIRRRNLL